MSMLRNVLVIAAVSACGCASPDAGPAGFPGDERNAGDEGAAASAGAGSGAGEESGTPSPPIPKGALALFSSVQMSSSNESMPVNGGTVSWSSSKYSVLRFVPQVARLDEAAWCSSESYAKAYIFPFTAGGTLYTVRVSLDTGQKTIAELDARSLAVRRSCRFKAGYDSGTNINVDYGNFAVIDGRVYYRKLVQRDFWNRDVVTGGELMVMSLDDCVARELQQASAIAPDRSYSVLGGKDWLLCAYEEEGVRTFASLDLATGEATPIFTTSEDLAHEPFAGDGGLYFPVKQGNELLVFRIAAPFTGELELVVSVPLASGDWGNLGLDEDRGRIFIAYEDPQPRFFVYDLAAAKLEQLDVPAAFFGSAVYANGHLAVLD